MFGLHGIRTAEIKPVRAIDDGKEWRGSLLHSGRRAAGALVWGAASCIAFVVALGLDGVRALCNSWPRPEWDGLQQNRLQRAGLQWERRNDAGCSDVSYSDVNRRGRRMEWDIDPWPDVLELRGEMLLEVLLEDMDEATVCEAAITADADLAATLHGAGPVCDGFLEFEDDAEEGRPEAGCEEGEGTLQLGRETEVSGFKNGATPTSNLSLLVCPDAMGVKPKRKRKPRARPPVKTPEEMKANAAAFHAWQRGERPSPPLWDVVEDWVRTR